MTIDQVLKLAELGFTKDEIMAFNGTADNGANVTAKPEQDPVPSEAPAEPAASVDNNCAKSDENAQNKQLDALSAQLKELNSRINAQNIQASNMPEPKKETLLDVMNLILK